MKAMTKTAAAYTTWPDSEDAGRHLGRQVREALGDQAPDALILFAPSRFDPEILLSAVAAGMQAETTGRVVLGRRVRRPLNEVRAPRVRWQSARLKSTRALDWGWR